MAIYDPSERCVLQLMEQSTSHRFYAAEIERETGLSKPTVSRVCDKLCEAGITRKSSETAAQAEQQGLPPRVFYELTDYGLRAIRLIPPSE